MKFPGALMITEIDRPLAGIHNPGFKIGPVGEPRVKGDLQVP